MRWFMSIIVAAIVTFSVSTLQQAQASDSFVQACSDINFVSNTVVCKWPNVTTAANVIACYVWFSDATSTVSGVLDSTNGTLTDSGLGIKRLNNAHSAYMYYKANIAGGTSSAITVTFADGSMPGTSSISCHEIAGRDTSSPLDQKQWHTQNFPASPAKNQVTSGSVRTKTNGQYVFGATHAQFGTNTTAGTKFTLRTGVTANHNESENLTSDQVSAGSIAATFTPFDVDGWITGIMTFKAAGGEGETGHRK